MLDFISRPLLRLSTFLDDVILLEGQTRLIHLVVITSVFEELRMKRATFDTPAKRKTGGQLVVGTSPLHSRLMHAGAPQMISARAAA